MAIFVSSPELVLARHFGQLLNRKALTWSAIVPNDSRHDLLGGWNGNAIHHIDYGGCAPFDFVYIPPSSISTGLEYWKKVSNHGVLAGELPKGETDLEPLKKFSEENDRIIWLTRDKNPSWYCYKCKEDEDRVVAECKALATQWKVLPPVEEKSSDPKKVWDKAIQDEIDTWKDWFSKHPEDLMERYNKPLDKDVDSVVKLIMEDPILGAREGYQLLEVGCGPCSQMGTISQFTNQLAITYLDPLGDKYVEMLKEIGLVRPHKCSVGTAENADRIFEEEYFDAIYAENCLDHGFNPELACLSLMHCLKIGGYFIFRHVMRAKSTNRGIGLHQWDFYIEDNCLQLSGYGKTVPIMFNWGSVNQLELKEYTDPSGIKFVFGLFQRVS
jgi:hypothetical protein